MNHFQQYLVEEFAEDYQEGNLSRRQALKLIGSVTGSLLLASSILAGCVRAEPEETAAAPTSGPGLPGTGTTPNQAQVSATTQPAGNPAATSIYSVDTNDPAVNGSDVQVPGKDATLKAYLAHPTQEGTFPVILVCHENRGLTEHIKDVTRRLAKAGYAALAVDLLSRQGGTDSLSSDQVPGALGNIPPEQFAQDFRSGWEYLKQQPFAQAEKVGMVGFCFGGGVTWLVATHMPELLAAVPFYGPPPPVEEVPKIKAAVLAIYAGNDQRINQSIPGIEAAMQQHNKIYEKVIYPDVDHAFHNDTGPRYNAPAAQDAWRRTLDWFERYVKG
jgi:carboxymethylenebutenolidase